MSADRDLCNLVAVDDVVGNESPRRIRRLIVFLLHLRRVELGCLEGLELCDSFYVVGGIVMVSALRLIMI